MKLTMELGKHSHDIIIKGGVLGRAHMLANLTGRVLLVTDDGVPAAYVKKIKQQCGQPDVLALRQGEHNKTHSTWLSVLERLHSLNLGRDDMLAVVGGGTVGDIAGFAAACHAHGMPWCYFPTTTLAQLDAAIGGRTGFDLGDGPGVGVYHQPQAVVIDPEVLRTLPARHHASGLAEGLKTGLVGSRELFEALEDGPPSADALERVIYLSARCKKGYVEQDETGHGLRRLLGFGYALGLGIKAQLGDSLLHGECVALGMLPMIESRTLLRRVRAAMKKLNLPLTAQVDNQKLLDYVQRATQTQTGACQLVRVKNLAQGYLDTVDIEEIRLLLEGG